MHTEGGKCMRNNINVAVLCSELEQKLIDSQISAETLGHSRDFSIMHPVSQTDPLPSYQDILPDAGRYQYSELHYYAQY